MTLSTCLQTVDAYKTGMRSLAAGVSLVTTIDGVQRAGLAATSVVSVCTDPPTLLVCVNKSSSAHDVIDRSGLLAINVLALDDLDLSNAFSDPNRRPDRFVEEQWGRLETGAPILKSALTAFDCQVVQRIRYQTHTIFLAEVQAVQAAGPTCDPLLYVNRQYRRLGELSTEPA